MRYTFLLYLVANTIVFFNACVTRNQLFEEIDIQFQEQNYTSVARAIEEDNSTLYPKTDVVLKYLDLGLLYFYAGNTSEAVKYLTEAEDKIEELYTRSLSQAIGSLVLNDTVIDYPGEPYEELYTNIFKAIAFIQANEYASAFVEIRRLGNKLNLLEDKYADLAHSFNATDKENLSYSAGSTEFYSSALGRYLSMLVYRADGNWDSAEIDARAIQEAFQNQPTIYNFPQPNLEPYLTKSDMARITPLAFVGRIPIKVEDRFSMVVIDNALVISLISENAQGNDQFALFDVIPWPGQLFDFSISFEVPRLEALTSEVLEIRVLANDTVLGTLHLIENIGNIAIEVYKVKEPIIYLKTISRAIIKAIVNEEAQKAAEKEDPLLGLLTAIIGDTITAVSEQADTRSARYFPGYAYTNEFLIEPGTYSLAIEYYGMNNTLLFRKDFPETEYTAGELNLIPSYFSE